MREYAENRNGRLGVENNQVRIERGPNTKPIAVRDTAQGIEFLMCPARFIVKNTPGEEPQTLIEM